jgi:LPXTG-motif cell wall-anchored protein
VRLWEVAGTSHSDLFIGYQSVFGHGPRAVTRAPRMGPDAYASLLQAAGQYGEQRTPLHTACILAGSTMPMRYATSAALHHLARWAAGGPAPAHGPRFRFTGGALARDPDGNTLGGIRLPPIDVPVASYASTTCALGGLTFPFSDLQLAQRYGSHVRYLALLAERTDAAVAAGWLLPEDAQDLMARACAARNRFPAPAAPCPPYTPPPFFQPLAAPVAPTGSAPPTTTPPDDATTTTEAAATSRPAPRRGRLPATGGSADPWPLAVGLVLAALALRHAARLPRGSGQRP